MATSVNASDANHHSSVELLQNEVLLNCVDKTWSILLCIIPALSTVTLTNIYSLFPDLGEIRDKLLFNFLIKRRPGVSSYRYLYVYCSVSKE